MTEPLRVGVLASGEGTNLQAILDRLHGHGGGRVTRPGGRAATGVEVAAVGANRSSARALERAAAVGVPVAAFELSDHADREARDEAMGAWLQGRGVDLVVLAGYMQLLTPGFLARFPDRVINVHPALLPAFPGIRAVEQAITYGVKVFGVTVHFVDSGVDSGRVIAQRAIALPGATEATEVQAALRPLEHDLLCETIALFAHGAIALDPGHDRRVLVEPSMVPPG